MRLLLDTHILLWTQFEPNRLSSSQRDLLLSSDNKIFFSAVSIWEIAIKASLGRTDFSANATEVLDASRRASFTEVVISSEVALRVSGLPRHHNDPFDRLLIAQAIEIGAALVTRDRAMALYTDVVLA